MRENRRSQRPPEARESSGWMSGMGQISSQSCVQETGCGTVIRTSNERSTIPNS